LRIDARYLSCAQEPRRRTAISPTRNGNACAEPTRSHAVSRRRAEGQRNGSRCVRENKARTRSAYVLAKVNRRAVLRVFEGASGVYPRILGRYSQNLCKNAV